MIDLDKTPIFEVIYAIVDYGMGSKVLQKAKEYGIRAGTIFLAKGTAINTFLKFLSLADERKEIVIMGANTIIADNAMDKLSQYFQFEKPNHGILFAISTCDIVGSKAYERSECEDGRGEKRLMYKLIITIVDRGKAEDVIEAANEAGSKGGTIVNARGSGVHETSKVFNMDIEPEKEMAMILSKEDATQDIVNSIREKLDLDKPGNGIIFIQDVSKTYGVFE